MTKRLTPDQQTQIINLFHSDQPSTTIASQFNVTHTTVENIWKKHFSTTERHDRRLRLSSLVRGERHPQYTGVTIDGRGYRIIYAPDWYTGYKDVRGRAREHLVKYCEYHGLTKIPKGHHVHHRNEDKQDNSFDNLELLSNNEHSVTHATRRKRDYSGRFY